MEKNHNHEELPHQDHTDDFSEEETQKAMEFYVGEDRLKELPVASPADLKHAWGAVDQDILDAMDLVALNTNDKEALEAKKKLKEDKQMQKKAAEKKLPSKNTGANLAKIQKQKRKITATKKKNDGDSTVAAGSSNISGRPATPPPPPLNQLQGSIDSDHDKAPKKGAFETHKSQLVNINIHLNQDLLIREGRSMMALLFLSQMVILIATPPLMMMVNSAGSEWNSLPCLYN